MCNYTEHRMTCKKAMDGNPEIRENLQGLWKHFHTQRKHRYNEIGNGGPQYAGYEAENKG